MAVDYILSDDGYFTEDYWPNAGFYYWPTIVVAPIISSCGCVSITDEAIMDAILEDYDI